MAGADNLTPFQEGEERAKEAGSKGGSNKKGSRHLSTLIRELADDIDWDLTTLKDKEKMKTLYGSNGWKAIVYVATTKAISGDTKAMDWLAKNGFGSKMDITTDDEPLNKVIVEWAKPVEKDKDNNTA